MKSQREKRKNQLETVWFSYSSAFFRFKVNVDGVPWIERPQIMRITTKDRKREKKKHICVPAERRVVSSQFRVLTVGFQLNCRGEPICERWNTFEWPDIGGRLTRRTQFGENYIKLVQNLLLFVWSPGWRWHTLVARKNQMGLSQQWNITGKVSWCAVCAPDEMHFASTRNVCVPCHAVPCWRRHQCETPNPINMWFKICLTVDRHEMFKLKDNRQRRVCRI